MSTIPHIPGFRSSFLSRLVVCLVVGSLGAPVHGADEVSAAVGVQMQAEASRSIYMEGADNTIYVQARIHVPELAADAPAPDAVRNVALVIDRSGSMAGASIRAAREGVTAVLGALSDRDVVAIVAFGSEVETLVEAQRCDQARDQFARIGEIQAQGGAALYDGLSQAAAQVRRYAGPGTVNQLVLLSDGPPTKGPREPEDFSKLVESFTREGIAVSTIGVGEEFDEDLLALLARIGAGRFHYAERPTRVTEAMLAEVAPRRVMVARDAEVTFEYKGYCDEVKAHGGHPASVDETTVTYRFPQLYAGQSVSVLASGVLDSFRSRISAHNIVRVRLAWIDHETGEPRELTRGITCTFSTDTRALQDTANVAVYRAAIASLIRDAMQEAIEQLDKGDFKRALRAVRRARDDAKDTNYTLEDVEITEMIRKLDAYIADVQARGMNQLDRKILRSGLFNQFEIPSADEEAKD